MEHLSNQDYPAQIKRLRARLGLTQVALAKSLGVSFPTINRWENGKARPSQLSWNQILKLAGRTGRRSSCRARTSTVCRHAARLDFTENRRSCGRSSKASGCPSGTWPTPPSPPRSPDRSAAASAHRRLRPHAEARRACGSCWPTTPARARRS